MNSTIVSISDIHFGALDPQYAYEQLHSQFVKRLTLIDFNILAICGDYFHSKYMGNNPNIAYGLTLMNEIVALCKMKNASLIVLAGTESHDSGQLSLFTYYLSDPMLDMYIVTDIKFLDVKGLRILCIPEKYGLPEEEYHKVLYKSGLYDICVVHGTFKNSVFGANVASLNSTHAPIFSIDHFCNCKGPIIGGHVHTPGVYGGHMYYNGSALRFRFGEEEEKGFGIVLYDNVSRRYTYNLVPIKSQKYITLNIENMVNSDPAEIIEYVKNKQITEGIDFIRLQFTTLTDSMNIIRSYFHSSSSVKIHQIENTKTKLEEINKQITQSNSETSYLIDPSISDYDKFVMYINHEQGCNYITVDELIKLLED